MTRRRNAQERKNSEALPSPSELLDTDINSMSEREYRVTITQAMARLEKTINDNIESIRAEVKAMWKEVKNANNEIQSNLKSLTARVTDAEDRISDLEDKLIEKKDQEEAWNKQLRSHENRIREISDTMKCSNVRIIGIPEGVEKEDWKIQLSKFWMKIFPVRGIESAFMS